MSGEWLLLRPWWLLGLALLALWLWRGRAGTADPWAEVVDPPLLRALGTEPTRTRLSANGLAAAALALGLLGLSGPAYLEHDAPGYRADVARVLVVDLSPGMAGDGTAPLPRVRLLLERWLDEAAEGETALVVYAEEPYLVAPLTEDARTLRLLVAELDPAIVPLPGDRPERALTLAATVLDASAAHSRQVVWVSAGRGADVGDALAALRHADVHVTLVAATTGAGLGAAAGVEVVPLAEAEQRLSALGAAPAGGALRENRAGRAVLPRDLGPWLLLPVLALTALLLRQGLPALLLGLVLFGGPAPPAWAADAPGQRAFDRGDYAAAAALFGDPRWRAAALYRDGRYAEAIAELESLDGADDHYNRGNALARLGHYAEALAAFDSALARAPGDADALHNRDLMRDLLTPPPAAPPGTPPPSAAGEAQMLAEQWLRGVPDSPATLLQRKLAQQHARRRAGEVALPW